MRENARVTERPSFLGDAPVNDETAELFAADREEEGYVANHTRLWAWRPDLQARFYELRSDLMASSTLTDRDWAVLVTSTAAELTDSYCSLAWGKRLARLAGDETAAQVIAGDAQNLTPREAALAAWARQVVRDPNATTEADVARLREVRSGRPRDPRGNRVRRLSARVLDRQRRAGRGPGQAARGRRAGAGSRSGELRARPFGRPS